MTARPSRADDRLALPVSQRVLRIIGSLVVSACAVMVVLGLTRWEDDLRGPRFLVYWSWCFLLALGAIFLALWDMLLVRRAFQRRRQELFREEFMTPEFVQKLRDAICKDEEGK
jgi:hypothetical protein